jgi:hypothetical protein
MDNLRFLTYWNAVGRPPIECGVGDCWLPSDEVRPFFTQVNYRIKDDPNWELRTKWIESDFMLPIEGFIGGQWVLVEDMSCFGYQVIYREYIPKES